MIKTVMRKKIFVSLSISALLLTTVFSPAASAASSFSTEANVKKALYALAAYDCISSSGFLQDTAIGNKYDSIINEAEYSKVYIGQWLGDANGMITCKDALTKTLGTGNITEAMLGSGKIFNGVYEKSSAGEQKITCSYGIVNSTGNATLEGTFSWPQGYFNDVNGERQDRRTHGVIEVVFNEDGPVRLEGATSGIDVSHTLESMKQWSIDWSQPQYICRPLVMYTEVYPGGEFENAFGETIMSYEPVLGTDDGTPFDEWGIHGDDRYHAWLHSNSEKFTHTVSPVTSSTQLKPKDNAQSKLLSNLATIYLGGATNATDFLNANADAKYILYGRYLFNGDGNGGFACGGITVATDDPNFNELKATDYWDTSQPYIASISAYKNGSASSKTKYRTKFGGDGLLSPGSAKSVNFPGVVGDCKALASQFNNINPSANSAKTAVSKYMKVGTVEELPPENTTDDADDADDDGSSVCYEATSPLGWVICPTLSVVGDATTGMYEYLESNFLTIDSSYMKSEDEHGTWKAWDNFRNLANIVFAIVLTVIILSQITGFGVSNYGVKKMLPTLIMVAVLSNLSFFLCEVAVDISNIVGYDVRRLLVDIAPVPGGDFGDGSLGTIIGNTFGALGIGTVAAAGGIFALVNWRTWIWPLLLVILAAVIGVFFFFLLLGARQAGIIILVALAPIAVICYALPNTKSIFSRWWKMFIGLLLVYPICGALMGGGQFASRLMLANVNSESGFMFTLVAMLLQSIAFFFVPGVVKSSFAAMGNLGMKLSSFGRSLSRGATGAIRKSEGYKNQVQRSRAVNADKALKRQAWRDKHGLSVRGRASGWAGRGGIRGAIGDRAKESRDRSQERRINAVAAQSRARQNAAFVAQGGLADAERRERDAAMKNYESGYRGDDAFMNDFGAQSRAYDAAIQAVDDEPSDMNARARLRALQNVLGSSADGQDIIQNTLHRRLATAQSRGETTVSAGMVAAGQTLMGDHGGFKSGNRGLNKLSQDLASGKALASDRGRYATTTLKDANGRTLRDKAGNDIYENNHYGAAAAAGSATELASANDSTLSGMLSSIQNGNMSTASMEAVYRNASEAITNDNISVKPENENMLNQIRQAAYEKLQGQQVGGYTDSTG
ncbi:MAG: hypothetical protein HFI06_12605 [Eubacterium sp.]|jgi:hypothetical protein|uniref:hypothetical protein n=1 Tax=Acutalibacter muris TaxID=1796620 RepID=UPI00216B8D3D|nr:hypothetical protein [Acutalibacter muris]MCI9379313.1 hypothetical protein [Eubacterium sp.]